MRKRAETGPMQFEGDWTGVFIRGDRAASFALELSILLRELRKEGKHSHQVIVMDGLVRVLTNSNEMNTERPEPQRMQQFEECIAED